ncbi:MAG: DUF2063 domain-containing protein [Alphaproteobacteria bacterium]
MMAAAFHDRFRAALLDPAQPVPAEVAATFAARFAVHRNNVVAGLSAAVAARFPAVARIVGDDFFGAMARVFVRTHPPRTPVLHEYGEAFPAFVEGFPPAAELPYLADVARLELARGAAWHAADADPVSHEVLAAIPPHALPEARLHLHPSLYVVASPHPILTIWSMNGGGREPEPIAAWRPQTVLVIRPHGEVEMREIAPDEARLIAELASGASLGAAVLRADVRDLGATLALLLETGAIVALDTHPSEEKIR